MAMYDVTLLKQQPIADGTNEFVLTKPDGFTYRAGQFFDIYLKSEFADDEKGQFVHGFSFASAPYEDTLKAATRMRPSAFKNAIAKLDDNTPIQIEAVWGEFVLPKKPKRMVFVIGGIGITPVLSMVKQATHDKTDHKMTLLLVNKTPAYAPYIKELKELANANSNFNLVTSYTAPEASGQGDEDGRLTADMIRRHVDDVDQATWYLSGPAGLVRASRELLVDQLNVDEDDLRTEEFDGY